MRQTVQTSAIGSTSNRSRAPVQRTVATRILLMAMYLLYVGASAAQCSVESHQVLSTAELFSERDFEPTQLSHQTIILSADKSKMLIGGTLRREAMPAVAALAQVDSVHDRVDFA